MSLHRTLRHASRRASVTGAPAAARTLLGAGAAVGAGDRGADASGDAHSVTVRPDPVAPGGSFAVFDGGSCPGEAVFGGAEIPKPALSPLRNQAGGTGTVPESTGPGAYTVTLLFGGGKGVGQQRKTTRSLAVSGEPGRAGAAHRTGRAGGRTGGRDGAAVPRGGSETGLGGGSGASAAVTVLGGARPAGAAGRGAVRCRRRVRNGRG
ncbi:hypothetical protein EYS09_21475 [Streptomyces kasugaensis]|uniref:Uncharacterized protein n=1 Tax=Streptomyces kasugaensis TaxID=1946 RepID=A0A4Q9HRS1_STRKA|nr:hypothetical protein [Streptomyces kasugaensis]TBO57684.1 hypothetical protein EYS09_21475 [Streptomyces kasugaensis]